jgi:hypothetical protein
LIGRRYACGADRRPAGRVVANGSGAVASVA